ncbi:hypothetical protein AVEN_228541-1 [Araneus ventricosus]|uniref:Uncharacterized protein n=1 Tax=Araneus ventricosus TaxID=182803 RepID=A0A4Y2UE54_ARAVE|nr:hypothetical protein AVEN_228541-1 [Araneus ventricosus]
MKITDSPVEPFDRFLIHMKAHDVYICHRWLPAKHHTPLWEQIFKRVFNAHSLWEKIITESPIEPFDRFRRFLVHLRRYNDNIGQHWLAEEHHSPLWIEIVKHYFTLHSQWEKNRNRVPN